MIFYIGNAFRKIMKNAAVASQSDFKVMVSVFLLSDIFLILGGGFNNNNNNMILCTGALAKSIVQLFCVWRSRGRRKGNPMISVVGSRIYNFNGIL